MLKKKHGVLWAATNSGKTEVAIAVIKALDAAIEAVREHEREHGGGDVKQDLERR